jgi:CelD/BcsL family acetyltransferase involved in cellulose biosynthesis
MSSRKVLTEIDELESLRDEWEALLLRSSANEPTLSPDWLLAWWRVFGGAGGRTLRVLTVRNDGKLVGLVPLLSRTVSYRPGIRFRRLELLASGEDEADEICSEYVGIVADRNHEAAVIESFADAVVRDELGPWNEIVLSSMDGGRLAPSLLAGALRSLGIDVTVAAQSWSPHVPLASSWDGYLGALPSSRRYLVRKSLRDYEAWAGAPPTLRFARTQTEVDGMRATLHRLHSERWAAAGSAGVFSSVRFLEFHDRVIPALLGRGALDLGSLEARGEPVAAFYNVVWNGKSYFYQGGRTLDVPKQVRLGVVMHACLIRNAIERGLREYDLLAGTSRYKVELALGMRPVVTLRATRPSLAETARCAAELAIGHARRLRRDLEEVATRQRLHERIFGAARATGATEALG